MDEKRPFAKAALIKDGVFVYIGDAKAAKALAGADVRVLDYGNLRYGVRLSRGYGNHPFENRIP